VIIARAVKTCKVYSIDSNPVANQLCIENSRINKVSEKVVPICADATDAIKQQLSGIADRVLMPLPERANEFIEPAVLALKEEQGGVVHYFSHIKADGKQKAHEEASKSADQAFISYDHKILKTTVVREVGPRIYQIVADVKVVRKKMR
jgi:tRNA (guanine37-N1)-methyltransferase